MAAPNIVNVSVITGKTAVQAVGTSATAIVTNTAASNKVVKVNALYVSNIENSTSYQITVDIYRGSTAYRMMTAVAVPAYSSLDIINKAIYLEEGDSLRLTANSANKLEAVASYEEIS